VTLCFRIQYNKFFFSVLLDIMLYSLVKDKWHFRWTYHLHLQGQRVLQARSPSTQQAYHQSTWCYILGDRTLQSLLWQPQIQYTANVYLKYYCIIQFYTPEETNKLHKKMLKIPSIKFKTFFASCLHNNFQNFPGEHFVLLPSQHSRFFFSVEQCHTEHDSSTVFLIFSP
jgi:hypothetical protein